jgi:hypothetical protein
MNGTSQWPGQRIDGAWPGQRIDAAPVQSSYKFRDKPVDEPALPSVSEYGDVGSGARWNQPASGVSPPTPYTSLPIFPQLDPERIAGAVQEGWQGSPSFWTSPQARQKAYDLPVAGPLAGAAGDIVGGLFGAGGALLRGGQEVVSETLAPISPALGRDVAAIPEAFPFGFGETAGMKPGGPRSAQAARDALGRKLTVEEITDAIRRSDLNAGVAQNQMMPSEVAPPSGRVPPPIDQPPPPPPAPDFIPPGSSVARVRPAEIPPSGAKSVDEQGVATRIQSPPNRMAPRQEPPIASVAGEAADNSAWIGTTIDELGNLIRENAAQGGPASLSAAATPEKLAAMSPSQAKAYRRMAEVNRVVSPIEGEDTSIKVPGSIPTEAEAKGDPVVSQQEKLVRDRKPDAYGGPDGRLTKNTNARVQLYDDLTLSDPQIDTLREDQVKQAQADTATINRNAGPVDGAGVATQLKQQLSDPRILEQPDVVKVLRPIHDALYDAEGNLKTDIQAYWGMHDNLMNKLAKAKDPLQASSSEKFAFNQLLDAKKAIDEAMDKASGGAFRTFLDNQAEFIKSQNAAKLLRDFRAKMIDPKTGNIYANKFHRFVTDLAVRRGRPGVDPAMDIPDQVFGKLMDINDDLKRAGRIDLGSPRGSPTNLYFELANGLGIVGAHSIMQAVGGGPVGSAVLQGGISALKQRLANMRLNSLVERSLNYPPQGPAPNPNPPGQFIPPSLRNPMMPP